MNGGQGVVDRHSQAWAELISEYPDPEVGRHVHAWEPRLDAIDHELADDTLAALISLVEGLAVGPRREAPKRASALVECLRRRKLTAARLGQAVRQTVVRSRTVDALVESGVPSTKSFVAELIGRLGQKVLPELDDDGDLRTVVREVFHRRADRLWLEEIPTSTVRQLLDMLGITGRSVVAVDPELACAIRVLAHHIGSLGLQPEITSRLPQVEDPDSPFLALSDRVLRYIRSFENDIEGDEVPLLADALETIALCRQTVERLRAEHVKHGTSLRLTGLSFRLLRLLDRLELLLHLTEPVRRDFQGSAVELLRELVDAEGTRSHLLPPVRERADLLAFQVVEHAAKKGRKYITKTRGEYFRFFVSSLGGGLIVAVFALFKVLMSQWTLPVGVQAFLYGINYALCFVLIYLTGATLATKQPAMTANTIARSLGDPGDRHLERLENLVVRVWRSQFASFAGNVAMALPLSLLLSELFFVTTGELVATPAAAQEMMAELHPWQSGTVLYAAAAGVFLFAAGLVGSWVDNRNLYTRLPLRVARHPWLGRLLGRNRARRLGSFLDRNLGVIVGNVFLGFALGSLGSIGKILGLPLDIRHIAFASAQLGTALEVTQFGVDLNLLWQVGLGVLVIGFVNFVVSFGLSLFVALKSRRITLQEATALGSHLLRRFFARPLDWFFPPKSESQQ